MNNLITLLNKHPHIKQVDEYDDQITFITHGDENDCDDDGGLRIVIWLEKMGYEVRMNDCEGCFNEYMVDK